LVGLVNGPSLSSSTAAFATLQASARTAKAVGQLWALDMVLANPDRFPLKQLAMRGNPNNVRWSVASQCAMGIDHTLARKPPRMMPCNPDAVAAAIAAVLEKPKPPPQLPSSSSSSEGTGPPRMRLRGHGSLHDHCFDGAAVCDEVLEAAQGSSSSSSSSSTGLAEGRGESCTVVTVAGEGKEDDVESKQADVEVDNETAALREGFRCGVAAALAPSVSIPLRAALTSLLSFLDEALVEFFGGLKKPSSSKGGGGGKRAAEMGSTRELRSLQSKASKDGGMAEAFRIAEDALARTLEKRAVEADDILCGRETWREKGNSSDRRACSAKEGGGDGQASSAAVKCPGVLSFLDFFHPQATTSASSSSSFPVGQRTTDTNDVGQEEQASCIEAQQPQLQLQPAEAQQQRCDMCAVSAYELCTRLQHILPRLDAAIAAAGHGRSSSATGEREGRGGAQQEAAAAAEGSFNK
jgi:hypothetical protein